MRGFLLGRWGFLIGGLVLGVIIGIVGASAPLPEDGETAIQGEVEEVQEEPSPSPSPSPSPTPEPENPDGEYDASCDYLLGDFSESASGYRFVGEADVRNTGNVGIEVEVVARWDQLGTQPISETKSVTVAEGRTRTVRFTRVASSDEIDLHQSADGDCNVKVTIVGTA